MTYSKIVKLKGAIDGLAFDAIFARGFTSIPDAANYIKTILFDDNYRPFNGQDNTPRNFLETFEDDTDFEGINLEAMISKRLDLYRNRYNSLVIPSIGLPLKSGNAVDGVDVIGDAKEGATRKKGAWSPQDDEPFRALDAYLRRMAERTNRDEGMAALEKLFT